MNQSVDRPASVVSYSITELSDLINGMVPGADVNPKKLARAIEQERIAFFETPITPLGTRMQKRVTQQEAMRLVSLYQQFMNRTTEGR